MAEKLLLKTENLSKTFSITKAVDNVDFEIYAGEIHGLIGENGSGKSTLAGLITGIHLQTSGRMLFEGEEYAPKNQVDANKHGISIILQEMSTIENLSVAENIFFGNESMFIKQGVVNRKAMNAKAREYLNAHGLDKINPANEISEYSFEERKLIELIKATYFDPKILVVDETTTVLSHDARDKLFRIIKNLKDAGTAIIIISHNLNEILDLCDRITVLRDGVLVHSLLNEGVTENDLKMYMVGRELSQHYYRDNLETNIFEEIVFEADNIYVTDELYDISFDLRKGEVLGIGGLTESGMHTLGKVLFGAIRPDKGYARLTQKDLIIKNIKQAIENGVAYTSKNRDQEGLVLQSSIKDNICLSALDKLVNKGWISPKREKSFSEKHVAQLQLKMENMDQFVSALSGGNKQKVVLSKWLSRDSEILILDSPTRGIDVMVKASIYALMQELVEQGKSIIMISEELTELIGMCDRLLVMKNGRINGELHRRDIFTEEKIIQFMI